MVGDRNLETLEAYYAHRGATDLHQKLEILRQVVPYEFHCDSSPSSTEYLVREFQGRELVLLNLISKGLNVL